MSMRIPGWSAVFVAFVTSSAAFGQGYTISTLAGGGLSVNVPGTSAGLYNPVAVAIDNAGNVFLADQNDILRLDATTGILTLVAGNGTAGFSGDNGLATSAQLNLLQSDFVAGIAVDAAGNLYIADVANQRVRKVSNGVITTVAGNGTAGFSGDGGLATSAQLDDPTGVAVDASGNLYIADSFNQRIREVSNGVITTVAGNGRNGSAGGAVGRIGDNGPATSGELSYPEGVAVDSAGNLYIADTNDFRVRKVTNGVITTVAGTCEMQFSCIFGGDGGAAASAELSDPYGVTVDSEGSLYIADAGNDRIRKVTNGVITTVAGNGTGVFAGDNGPATSASLDNPYGVAVDSAGNLYIADSLHQRIRKVTNGVITTVAGNGEFGFGGDGGPATSAQLNKPFGSAIDSAGNLYIADTDNNRIRKVANGVITTVAGSSAPLGGAGYSGPATGADLYSPDGVAVDSEGNLYIADGSNSVREVSNGTIMTVAGNGATSFGGDGGPATSASVDDPTGLAVDSAGNLYIADSLHHRIREVSNGVITTVAGNGTKGFSGDGGPATSAELNNPFDVAVDSAGNLYIADLLNYRIRKVTNGIITTVAGNGAAGFSGDGGPATSAELSNASGVAVDAAGNLYIADAYNNRIRKVANGVITTIAGDGAGGFGGDNGVATNAALYGPAGLAVDSTGNVYIADTSNNRIRILTPGTSPVISQSGVVPIYSATPVVQSGSWISIYGTSLASESVLWNGNFPESLGGTSVTIDNNPAYLLYVSPNLINVQVPDDSTTGQVSVAVTTTSGTGTSTVTLAPAGPSFLLLGDGRHAVGEIATPNGNGAYDGGTYDLVGPSNTFSYSTRPVNPGETLTLYGVGFGPTTPHVPAGQIFSGSAPVSGPVTITIGGVPAKVIFAGITEAGLYQFDLTVPPNTGTGDQAVQATLSGGVQTPAGPVITVQ